MLALVIFLYQSWFFIQVCWYRQFNPNHSAVMAQQLERLQQQNKQAKLKHHWLDYNQISNHLKRSVIAAEDAKFSTHHGFDWDGIKYAYQKNLKRGKIVAGGSTISQQLAKNLFLSSHKTPWRKGQEAIITVMIELVMSKQRILEIYLNIAEWGNGVFGAQAASQYYFKRNAHQLSRMHAAKLAAMLPNPRYYDKHRTTHYLANKTSTIRKRMRAVRLPNN